MLCAILGAHVFLLSLMSVNDNPRSARRSEEVPGILFFVELPKPNDTQPSTHSSSRRPVSTYDPSLKSRAANTITLPPEIEGTDALGGGSRRLFYARGQGLVEEITTDGPVYLAERDSAP